MPAFEMDESIPVRWNRQQWLCVFSSHSPTIRKVTEYLGLGLSASSSNTNRGIPKFDVPEYRRLSSEVSRLSKDLPKDRDALLAVATDGQSLERELDDLLDELGPQIWGRDADRSRLLTADPANKTYPKDLVWDDQGDREMQAHLIKTHVHRWIVIKACYYIRNQKLKRYSALGETDTLADFDVHPDAAMSPSKPQLLVKLPISSSLLPSVLSEPQSPNATPQTGTPAPPETTNTTTTTANAMSTSMLDGAHFANDRKRKSDPYLVDSDAERYARATDSPPPTKRPYSSASVPLSRKSPRKSLSTGRLSTENIPPLPDLAAASHRHSSAGAVAQSDASRALISPVSSNALNDIVKPENAAPRPDDVLGSAPTPASGFTAVNAPNAAPHQPLPPKGYTSPYGVPPGAHTPPNAPTGVATQPPYSPQTAPSNVPNGVGSQPVQQTQAPVPPPPSASNVPNGTPIQPAHPTQAVASMPNGAGVQYMHHSQESASARASPVHQHAAHPHHAALAPRPQQQSQLQPQPDVQPLIVHHAPNKAVLPSSTAEIHCSTCGKLFSTESNLQRHLKERICTKPPAAVPFSGYQYGSQTYNSPNFSPRPQAQELAVVGPRKEDIDMLQCELLRDLMQFLFPKNDQRADESIVLHKLDVLWRDNAVAFRRQIGPLWEAQNKVLYAWIEERRKIGQLQRSLESRPGVVHMEMIDRLLAMNDLRVMRLKWKGMKTHDGVTSISSEELLCRTFATITKTEGTEHLFQTGLEKLNESIFGFLQSEDMKISLSTR